MNEYSSRPTIPKISKLSRYIDIAIISICRAISSGRAKRDGRPPLFYIRRTLVRVCQHYFSKIRDSPFPCPFPIPFPPSFPPSPCLLFPTLRDSSVLLSLSCLSLSSSPFNCVQFAPWGPLSLPLNHKSWGLGSAVSSHSGSRRSPHAKRILVHFEVKIKHFKVSIYLHF